MNQLRWADNMPELPEVETVVRGLAGKLIGKSIQNVEVRNLTVIRGDFNEFWSGLGDKTVLSIGRHGKFIFISLQDQSGKSCNETPLTLRIHLGMTGQLVFEPPEKPLGKHTHVVFKIKGLTEELRYDDIRRFGFLEIIHPPIKTHLGPDAWSASEKEIVRALRSRKGMVKHALLNQKVISGLGNIYVDETLYRCGIHPRKRLDRLSKKKMILLYASLRDVLRESLEAGGTSFRNYVDTQGGRGGYQGRLRVYGKQGTPCRCGTIIRRIVVAGRGTHFCPACQK